MSANQAMSSARRRRGTPADRQGPPPPGSSAGRGGASGAGRGAPAAGRGAAGRGAAAAGGTGAQPPVHPLALVLQHDRRLFEIENQIPAALDTINSNIDVLSEGYNALTVRLDEQSTAPSGAQTATGAHALIDTKVNTALSEALAAKTLAAGATAACESFRINDIRELQAAHEELKAEIAELRDLVCKAREDASVGDAEVEANE